MLLKYYKIITDDTLFLIFILKFILIHWYNFYLKI